MTSDPQDAILDRRKALILLAGACALPAAPSAWAQADYPSRPIHLVIGFPPGGSVDRVGRLLAEALARTVNGTFVVENLSGAAGALGAQKVASSAADGYTVLIGSNNELVITGLLNKAQRYDPIKDFSPIGLIGSGPVVWVAGPTAGASLLDDSIRSIRSNPGKFSYGTAGVGSLGHFAGELFKKQAGLFIPHIPYRGVAPLVADLIGGRIEYAMMSPTAALPHLQAGQLVALGVTTTARATSLPGVPALGEHRALKGYQVDGWFAMVGPNAMPASMQARLRSGLQQALQEPELRRKLEETGLQAASGREDISTLMVSERLKFEQLVRFAHITE